MVESFSEYGGAFLAATAAYSQGRVRSGQVREREVQTDRRGESETEKARGKSEEAKSDIGKLPHPEDRDWVPPGLRKDGAGTENWNPVKGNNHRCREN